MKNVGHILNCLLLFTLTFAATSSAEEIKLMFPQFEQGKPAHVMGLYWLAKEEGKQLYSEEDLKSFVQKFEKQGYWIDQIELWVEGKAESNGVTRFFVSVEGGGGIKIILRPKGQR
jgi:hypothetical protein